MVSGDVARQTGLIVLAGGQSQRMGTDKASLMLGGRSLLSRVVEAGRGAGVDRCVVVASRGQVLPAIGPEVVVVRDPIERTHEGPLSGLLVGLTALHEAAIDIACIAPCDAPWFSSAHVEQMFGRLGQRPTVDAIVPSELGDESSRPRIHPLHAVVRVRAARAAAAALVADRQRAAKALFAALATERVATTALVDPRVVQGCNTPAQWQRVRAMLGDRD